MSLKVTFFFFTVMHLMGHVPNDRVSVQAKISVEIILKRLVIGGMAYWTIVEVVVVVNPKAVVRDSPARKTGGTDRLNAKGHSLYGTQNIIIARKATDRRV